MTCTSPHVERIILIGIIQRSLEDFKRLTVINRSTHIIWFVHKKAVQPYSIHYAKNMFEKPKSKKQKQKYVLNDQYKMSKLKTVGTNKDVY